MGPVTASRFRVARPTGRIVRPALAIALLLALLLLLAAQAHAATITPNTTTDELNSDGDCSLREAVQAANTNAGVDACAAGSGADLIDLPAGTYDLTLAGAGEDSNATGDLDIMGSLTVDGPAAATTIIDGAGLDRVFHLLFGSSSLAASNLTIRDGAVPVGVPGGAFVNPSGALTLTNVTVSGNTGHWGGGVNSGGTTTLENVTLSGNTATNNGGAIYNGGGMTLTNVTVSGNTATNNGGGIGHVGGSVGLTNVTVAGNTATTGGAIWSIAAAPTLKNTIIAYNSGGNCSGAVASSGHNLEDANTCSLTAAGDLVNTDPILGPLADNGGSTWTHGLLDGSPAINAGSGDCPPPAADQRGVARPQGAACDIGAFEALPLPGYPRPKGATPLRVSLVPAYTACAAPNRVHGPPLAFASCNLPVQTSALLTVGTADANGAPANSVGSIRLGVIVGTPGSLDDADVNVVTSIIDVRCSTATPPATCGSSNAAAGPDYTGELLADATLRITDKDNSPPPTERATVVDIPLTATVPCASTASTGVGSICSLATTLDTLVAGAVKEGRRAIWELRQVRALDGGPDGVASTAVNTLFEVQGVFVP